MNKCIAIMYAKLCFVVLLGIMAQGAKPLFRVEWVMSLEYLPSAGQSI